MIDKYIKYFIVGIIFLGLLSSLSIYNTKNDQYKQLIHEAVLENNIEATRFLLNMVQM